MGLTCSVLGHRFGDLERVEEREEQGSEVVLTIREVKRCERCAHDSVVSESKEVTSIDPAPNTPPVEDEAATDEAATDEMAADGTATDAGESRPTEPDPTPAWPNDEPFDPDVEDDGVILENDPTVRARGQWPPAPNEDDDQDESQTTFTAWPEVEGEDEGYSASSPRDAEDVDESDVSFTGLTPEVDDPGAVGADGDAERSGVVDADDDAGVDGAETGDTDAVGVGAASDTGAEVLESTDVPIQHDESARAAGADTATGSEIDAAGGVASPSAPSEDDGFARAGSIKPPSGGAGDDVEQEYFCPRCEFVKRSIHASVRPGDICPSCRRGYLAARELD